MARLMKHSGVDWLGDIPDDWKIRPLKGVAERIIVGLATSVTQYYRNAGTPIFRNLNIKDDELVDDNIFYLDEEWASLQSGKMIKSGDILTVHTGYIGISCIVPEKYDGALTFTTLITTPRKEIINTRFLMRYINVSRFYSPIYFNVETGAQNNLNTKAFVNLEVTVPPIDEQERIAAYLDDKCGRIDSVIAKTVAAVAEYKKLKQAIITRAVTRGIRANRTLKHSGIEWLGDIPDDWNVKKIKMCISFVNGFAFESSVLEKEGTYPVIRIGDIKNGTVDFMNANFINESTLQLEPFRIKKNDILIAMSGATVGKLAYITDEPPISFINQRVGIIRSSLGKFIYYCLSTDNFMKYILLLSEGTAQPNISTKNINNYYITIPPIDEQREIAAYLDEKTSAIDSLVAKKNQLVAELERLKKSLIFEYVTGKKEVAQ